MRPGRYKLHSHLVATDLKIFEDKQKTADDKVEAGSLAEASLILAEALSLWTGPALDGLDGQFADAESARLGEDKLKVLVSRIDIDLWRGRYRDLVPELASLVSSRRNDDRFCMRLMLALHGSGRTPEALDVFRLGREVLKEDFGMDPGRDPRAAHEAILGDKPMTEILSRFTPLSSANRPSATARD